MSEDTNQSSLFGDGSDRPDAPIVRLIHPEEVSLSAMIVRDVEHVSAADIAQLADHMRAHGQLYPARCRYGAGGTIELVAGFLRWQAAQLLVEQGHDFRLLIQLEKMTDDEAIRIAFVGTELGVPVPPIQLARYVARKMEERGLDQTGMAALLGVDKSNVSRLLDVLRAVELVGNKIDNEGDISRAQAAALMHISRTASKDDQKKLKKVINSVEPGSARDVFGDIAAAFRPLENGGQDIVGDDDVIVGSIKPVKGGGYAIKLDKRATQMELSHLMRAVHAALNKLITG